MVIPNILQKLSQIFPLSFCHSHIPKSSKDHPGVVAYYDYVISSVGFVIAQSDRVLFQMNLINS